MPGVCGNGDHALPVRSINSDNVQWRCGVFSFNLLEA